MESMEALSGDIRAEVRPYAADAFSVRSDLTLTHSDGTRVSCELHEPREPASRRPGILVLEGPRAGRAFDGIEEMQDAVVLALACPLDPKPGVTVKSFFRKLPEVREAALGVVPTARLLLEYLRLRPDVDATRIVLLGYDFAAPLVPRIAAEDKGLALAGMIYGGGDLRTLIAHNVRRSKGWLMSQMLGLLGSLLLGPLDPIRHANEVAPTRLLMVNGRRDEWVPRRNVEALYRRASNPKKIIWLDSGRLQAGTGETSRRIKHLIRDELVSLRLLNATS
jgi:hypothetical protein